MEHAAARRVYSLKDVAADHDALASVAVLRTRGDGRDEGRGIGVPWPLEDLLRLGELDDVAEVHDGDPRADLPHHREVVRDEDVGEVELGLERAQQVEDLRLDRDVERRDRLVAHDQLRVQRQSAGDADPLPLAARELVRVPARVLRAQADDSQSSRTRASPRPATPPWIANGCSTIFSTVFRGFSDA